MDGRRLRVDPPQESFERSLVEFERLLALARADLPISTSDSIETSSPSGFTVIELINAELASLEILRRRERLKNLYRP